MAVTCRRWSRAAAATSADAPQKTSGRITKSEPSNMTADAPRTTVQEDFNKNDTPVILLHLVKTVSDRSKQEGKTELDKILRSTSTIGCKGYFKFVHVLERRVFLKYGGKAVG